uniref:MFS domain-containing protein n=1 Tax=Syphacia muris TaxID=451379 RepID=A0A0N5AQQ5_9BILA
MTKLMPAELQLKSDDIIEMKKKKMIDVDYEDVKQPRLFVLLRQTRILISIRMFTAALMSLCFIALSVTTSNLSGTMVCMFVEQPQQLHKIQRSVTHSNFISSTRNVESMTSSAKKVIELNNESIDPSMNPCHLRAISKAIDEYYQIRKSSNLSSRDANIKAIQTGIAINKKVETVQVKHCHAEDLLDWTSFQKGIVFAAQNVGCLIMLFTGRHADRLNGKWTVAVGLAVSIVSNILTPILAQRSIGYVIFARILTGMSDALMTPSINSMITRWFPPKERPFAIGFVTGGRQIGNLLILPVSGYICSRGDEWGGWKPTYYISAAIGSFILLAWLVLSADKPTKHLCVRKEEADYILRKIGEEALEKRKERADIPWKELITSKPLIAGIFALVCHEYPLVIMLTLLPTYLKEVLGLTDAVNGVVSALPILTLWLSKTASSTLSSYLTANLSQYRFFGKTPLVKFFNFIASAGLSISLALVPLLTKPSQIQLAIIALCAANGFAGLHTPGVQTALMQIAPAFTGAITGISFSVVALSCVINKLINGFILDTGSRSQWIILFEMSAAIAILPVVFFTIWGSADRQAWAIPKTKQPLPKTISTVVPISVIVNNKTSVAQKQSITSKLSMVKPKQSILEKSDQPSV